MNYQDQTLTCRDCTKPFVFTARDQEFFAEKGFTNAPTRCKECRNLRKKPGAAGDPAAKILYKISCKKCGKVSEMATQPRKPGDVMCSECFYAAFEAQQASDQAITPAVIVENADDVTGIAPTEE